MNENGTGNRKEIYWKRRNKEIKGNKKRFN